VPIRIVEVAYDDERAQELRRQLNDDLDQRYAPLHAPAESDEVRAARAEALRTRPEEIVQTWLALDEGGAAAGHVILRRLGEEWELKRLVVTPAARRRGVGRALTAAVVDRARTDGAHRVILQTGAAQPESLALYTGAGFRPIPVYEPYVATMAGSLCFALDLD